MPARCRCDTKDQKDISELRLVDMYTVVRKTNSIIIQFYSPDGSYGYLNRKASIQSGEEQLNKVKQRHLYIYETLRFRLGVVFFFLGNFRSKGTQN